MTYKFAVRYPNNRWLGWGYLTYAEFGVSSGYKYSSRVTAMKAAGVAGLSDPKIVRFRVRPRCPKCGKRA